MLDVRIVDAPPRTVMGLETPFRHVLSEAANAAEVIPALWDRFAPRIGEIATRTDLVCLGVITELPASERPHPDTLRYLACVPVKADARPPLGMVVRCVPAGSYAVFTLKGPISMIGEHCEAIYRTWLPASPYRHAGNADIELYDERFNPESETSVIEYWISIAPRAEGDADSDPA